MQDIKEGSKSVAGNITNLRLVHERLIEQVGSILLFNLLLAVGTLVFFAFALLVTFFLLGDCSRDVESHLDKFVSAQAGLASSVLCAARRLFLGSRCIVSGQEEFNGDFIPAREVCV